jgi:hypothetical protein
VNERLISDHTLDYQGVSVEALIGVNSDFSFLLEKKSRTIKPICCQIVKVS